MCRLPINYNAMTLQYFCEGPQARDVSITSYQPEKEKEAEDTYIDGQGNTVKIIKKKKVTKQELKKIKKKIAALRKAGWRTSQKSTSLPCSW